MQWRFHLHFCCVSSLPLLALLCWLWVVGGGVGGPREESSGHMEMNAMLSATEMIEILDTMRAS